ncbi:MAG TPA: YafY family protein [Thermomicrobiales bacterium]|nr:YafY family protein [Thermomicrobiales bacterium]
MTYSPTTRLLTVLERLQSSSGVTGPDLAAELEVDIRSVRRYVSTLRDLGIPIKSEPGRHGFYRMQPGFRLPPLMFNNREVMAILLGLMSVRRLGLADDAGAEQAIAKIERVLPSNLKAQSQAIQNVLTISQRPSSFAVRDELIGAISLAAFNQQQVFVDYEGANASSTTRVIDPYGIAFHSGRWYVVAHCNLRNDLRTFRLDRFRHHRTMESGFERPLDFDALSWLWESIRTMPGTWQVEALFSCGRSEVQERVAPHLGQVLDHPEGVCVRIHASDLRWTAGYLMSLELPFRVLGPPELKDEFRTMGARLTEIANA